MVGSDSAGGGTCNLAHGRADALQDRVAGLERAQLVLESVVRRVGDERLAVVVGVLVLAEQLGELGDAIAEEELVAMGTGA